MIYDTSFVASVLEGCEGTIAELMQVTGEDPKLAVGLDSLKSQIESLRRSIESGPETLESACKPVQPGELRPDLSGWTTQ